MPDVAPTVVPLVPEVRQWSVLRCTSDNNRMTQQLTLLLCWYKHEPEDQSAQDYEPKYPSVFNLYIFIFQS